MKKQKIQMLVVVILLVICVFAYIFISTQGNWIPQRMTDQMHPWEM